MVLITFPKLLPGARIRRMLGEFVLGETLEDEFSNVEASHASKCRILNHKIIVLFHAVPLNQWLSGPS
jgi:hypothetical protein